MCNIKLLTKHLLEVLKIKILKQINFFFRFSVTKILNIKNVASKSYGATITFQNFKLLFGGIS